MTRQNGDDNIDKWTGSPIDFEDGECEPLTLPGPRAKNNNRFDFGSMLWKFVASSSATTPSPILSILCTDEKASIRRRCAENVATSAEALALLADDTDETVRAAVARNRHTPLFILRKLSADESPEVRFAIASNPEMPDAILLSLFMDPNPYVAERASQTLAA
jgi:Leucine rich repeat variant